MPIFAVMLGACATAPQDLGRSDVDELMAARGQIANHPASSEATEVFLAALSNAPLTQDSVVQIALINNPNLKATYATLGFAAADVYEAGRIRNPVFSGASLDSSVAGESRQVTLGLAASFADLVTMPARKRLSASAFVALKQSVGAEVLAVVADAEKAYFQYIGAKQVSVLRKQTAKSADLSAALALRFYDAGNLSARGLALERAAASEARLRALETEAATFSARTELASVLGLSVGDGWDAPAQLGVPLETEDPLDALLALARHSRLDLAAAYTRADLLADRLGVVNWTRWLGELNVGIEREDETDGARLTGPILDWEVPIFNQHQDLVLRANADLQIALAEVLRISNDVDNGVRLAYAVLENAKSRIREYQHVLMPQRVEAVARGQEEVNFMLIGIFELIAMKQDEYDAYQGYLDAIRDYWIARVDLSRATGAALPSSADIGDKRIDVEDFIRPAARGMDHSGHGSMSNGGSEMSGDNAGSVPMDHSKHNMRNSEIVAPETPENGAHPTTGVEDETNETPHDEHSKLDEGEPQ